MEPIAMSNDELSDRPAAWFGTQMPDVDGVRVEGLEAVDFGHSAEMMLLTLVWSGRRAEQRRDVVIRLRPPEPGLLEPYDLRRQFDVLRCLADAPVRAPAALFIEETGDVLGRPFVVMEKLPGSVYELEVPAEIDAPERIRRMCESLIEQIVTIHNVDVHATGIAAVLGDGADFVDREINHWEAEMNRVKRGTLPALERLVDELRRTKPAPSEQITLVHGDTKPGNFAFVDGEVSAVFDWELTTVGDPLADIGFLELMWMMPIGITSRPGALTVDEAVEYYEKLGGVRPQNRPWYRAFQAFKLSVILLLGAMLVQHGHSTDRRHVDNSIGLPLFTDMALRDLGITEQLEPGPYGVSEERLQQLD